MSLDRKNLVALAKATLNANPASPVAYSFGDEKFSYKQLNETLRDELNSYAYDYSAFRRNKNTIFEIMEETLDDVLPKRVMEQYKEFAEVKQYPQGVKPIFVQRITEAARRRAKQFVTRVGLAGVYEVFKLDGQKLEVTTSAYGGAAQIAFEEFLDGRIMMSDVLDIILEGLDEQIFIEIQKALIATYKTLGTHNKVEVSGFNEAELDKILTVADSYGKAVIYCAPEFANKIVPAEGWVSDAMRDEKWNTGHLGNYKNHKVVVFEQSFTDETNAEKVIDPAYAWIIPAGAEKPVKIAFEGNTIVRNIDNADMSMEVQIYKKFGIGVQATNNICAYHDTSLDA